MAVGVAGLLLVGGALAQNAWHTLTGPDRNFSIELPGGPQHTEKEMRTGAGTAYTMHQYLFEAGTVAYLVQSAVYPKGVDISDLRSNLQTGLENAARKLDGGRWASFNWARHQGLAAIDALGTREGQVVRSYAVMDARQILTLTYAGPPGTAHAPAVERFIASLRITH